LPSTTDVDVLHEALQKVQAALKELHVELEDAREQRRVADALLACIQELRAALDNDRKRRREGDELLVRMRDNLRSTLDRNNPVTHAPGCSLRPPKAV